MAGWMCPDACLKQKPETETNLITSMSDPHVSLERITHFYSYPNRGIKNTKRTDWMSSPGWIPLLTLNTSSSFPGTPLSELYRETFKKGIFSEFFTMFV